MEIVCVWIFCHKFVAVYEVKNELPMLDCLPTLVDELRVLHYDDVVLILERS